MRRYGGEFERGYGRRPDRPPPGGPYQGYGPRGYYGYEGGRRGYGADYLSAWGPGGWSREHGREIHGGRMGPAPGARYDRGYHHPLSWWRDDGAPTG